MTAFASATQTVIGQESFRSKDGDSEIIAARVLFECLDLTGQLVTTDAPHCQNETAKLILDRGGDYLLRLKANRPTQYEMVVDYFETPGIMSELSSAETTDGDHGRIEHRRAIVSYNLDWIKEAKTSCCEPDLLPAIIGQMR